MNKASKIFSLIALVLAAMIFLFSGLLLGGSCLAGLILLGSEDTSADPSDENGLILGAPDPAPDPNAPPLVSEELSALLKESTTSPSDLAASGCKQLIVVSTEGSNADIRFFYAQDGVWTEDADLSSKGFVGKLGAGEAMAEGKMMTPVGFFTVGEAFYTLDAPKTRLESFQITEETYWVDDPESVHYNTRVEGTTDKDWSSAEHMIDYAGYRYGFTIGYNPECIPGKGSAIFFHISDRPTAGCVGASEETVVNLLSVLNPEENPHLLII